MTHRGPPSSPSPLSLSSSRYGCPRRHRASAAMVPDTILYGAAYYTIHAYERLAKDVELMSGPESPSSGWGVHLDELGAPRGGVSSSPWMDRVVDAMHAAGIKVVMGTPTYSIPPWLYAKPPPR